MSLYNALFGVNKLAPLFLASLNLTTSHVGRFRDCWLTEDGKIAVYTRNGGGNREECSCDEHGAGHHYRVPGHEHTQPVTRRVTHREVSNGVLTTWEKLPPDQHFDKTTDEWFCDSPESEHCACTACIANYVLPKHPAFLDAADDEFDCTYRTFWFTAPDDIVKFAGHIGENRDPSERWLQMIDSIRDGKRPEVVEAMRPLVEAISGALTES